MTPGTGITGRAESAPAGTAPPLSVVMPVHNAMPHLPGAIESVLSQTFRDFELFIGDDCSTDAGFECIRAYAARDSRIRYARSETRMGPVASSNWVANEARAPIVARMDGDDISHPRRFDLQMQVLAAHPDAAMVGSLFDLVDETGRPLRASNRSTLVLGRFVPFSHPTIMYRNEAFQRAGRYREGTDYFEDTDLFVRMLEQGSILVIAADLLSVRKWGVSARHVDDQQSIARAMIAASHLIRFGDAPQSDSTKIRPGNVRALLEHTLWSGLPPSRVLPLAAQMRMSPLTDSIPTLLWLAFCIACPPVARQLGRCRVAWRNFMTRDLFKPGHIYRWVPGRQAIDLGPMPEEADSTSSAVAHAAG